MVSPGPGLGSGFYWGIAGGASIPARDLRTAYNTGWNVTVPLGWSPAPESPWGLRLDVTYDRFNVNGNNFNGSSSTGSSFSSGYNSGANSPWAAGANLDLLWKFPFSYRAAFYVLGGGGVQYFKTYAGNPGFNYNNTGNTSTSGSTSNLNNGFFSGNQSTTRFSVNGGGGISFGWGAADVFVESRYFNSFMGGANNATGSGNFNVNWVPIIVGFTIR